MVGYPTDRVVRYVEDDPAKGERATSTSVDPNSFGGLLARARRPDAGPGHRPAARLPPPAALAGRWPSRAWRSTPPSRSALLAAVAAAAADWAAALPAAARGWAWSAAAVLALGLGGSYLARLQSGFALQDQAQLMRLAEYQNALTIIGALSLFRRRLRHRRRTRPDHRRLQHLPDHRRAHGPDRPGRLPAGPRRLLRPDAADADPGTVAGVGGWGLGVGNGSQGQGQPRRITRNSNSQLATRTRLRLAGGDGGGAGRAGRGRGRPPLLQHRVFAHGCPLLALRRPGP